MVEIKVERVHILLAVQIYLLLIVDVFLSVLHQESVSVIDFFSIFKILPHLHTRQRNSAFYVFMYFLIYTLSYRFAICRYFSIFIFVASRLEFKRVDFRTKRSIIKDFLKILIYVGVSGSSQNKIIPLQRILLLWL